MSKWDKLLNRMLSLSNDLRFEELRKVLESYGYVMFKPKGGSSHCTFRKQQRNPITIPKHQPIKKAYVEMVKKVIEEAEENENSSAVHGNAVQNGNNPGRR
ncbi:MAG: type II toxin-antitoxin system HicA family toxin [Erysipelotrichaceae bacterium]|nr:type II toxin-antitoxin system HicA family toxin [Erysipelotrichaceae bacterium]MBR5049227.1 type II toxin-antitoxin system HicA family toxin [Erysipelotrichaceae bacterium]